MQENTNYCWVVTCKNYWFHLRRSVFFSHRIPLGVTDDFAACPAREGEAFAVRCDECGKEYWYKQSDVRRAKRELPRGFNPHPRFW